MLIYLELLRVKKK